MNKQSYLTEYDAILSTMQKYVEGCKQGRSETMRPAFHPEASFFGYVGDQLASGTRFLFDWIDRNGSAPRIEPRFVSVDILESIAVVRLEVAGWSGKLVEPGVRMSDLFTLLRTPEGWRIIQKALRSLTSCSIGIIHEINFLNEQARRGPTGDFRTMLNLPELHRPLPGSDY